MRGEILIWGYAGTKRLRTPDLLDVKVLFFGKSFYSKMSTKRRCIRRRLTRFTCLPMMELERHFIENYFQLKSQIENEGVNSRELRHKFM